MSMVAALLRESFAKYQLLLGLVVPADCPVV